MADDIDHGLETFTNFNNEESPDLDSSVDFDQQGEAALTSDALSDCDFKEHMDLWKESAKKRPLRVLVCGLGGSGKSSLINSLLQLKGRPDELETTSVISKYTKTTASGIKVCVFDTPGLDNIDQSREELIAMMEKETEKKLDIVFYCISLGGPSRVQHGDMEAIKIMTQAFSSEIWKKTVIVFTFANDLERRVQHASQYETTINNVKEKVKQVLKNEAHVQEDIIAALPIISAGHNKPVLKYEAEECRSWGGWENRLFFEALKQVDPAALPALFAVRFSWNDLRYAIGDKTAVIATIGGGVGAIVGGATLAAPLSIGIGASVGAIVGAGIGVGVGVAGVSSLGALLFQLHRIMSIIKIKYKAWKMGYSPPHLNKDSEPP